MRKNKQADGQLIREADSQRNAAGRPNLAQTESNGTNMSRLSNVAGKQRGHDQFEIQCTTRRRRILRQLKKFSSDH